MLVSARRIQQLHGMIGFGKEYNVGSVSKRLIDKPIKVEYTENQMRFVLLVRDLILGS